MKPYAIGSLVLFIVAALCPLPPEGGQLLLVLFFPLCFLIGLSPYHLMQPTERMSVSTFLNGFTIGNTTIFLFLTKFVWIGEASTISLVVHFEQFLDPSSWKTITFLVGSFFIIGGGILRLGYETKRRHIPLSHPFGKALLIQASSFIVVTLVFILSWFLGFKSVNSLLFIYFAAQLALLLGLSQLFLFLLQHEKKETTG